jgi:hypothetical protein
VVFFLGLLVIRPAAARVGTLGRSMAQEDDEAVRAATATEMDRVRRRSAAWSGTGTVLLVLSAAGMAVARYLG